LTSLRNERRPDVLKPEHSASENFDGSVTVEFGADPYDEILGAIDCFLKRSAGVYHQGGGRKTVLYYAVARLVSLLQQSRHKLSIRELEEELCQDLFDKVRERNESLSGPLRYHDMLRRICGHAKPKRIGLGFAKC
jgi:hypothetical protein